MKRVILFFCLILSTYSYSDCNHTIVDPDPRFACVTVVNKYNKALAVTGLPGFSLDPNTLAETMLLSGSSASVQITPNPYSRFSDQKQLRCIIKVSEAKKTKITITYKVESYDVTPIEFKNNCEYREP